MTPTTPHPLVMAYLERLRRAAGGLDRGRREELVGEIEAHLAEAVGPDASEAEVRNALDRLGEPEEILAGEAPAAAADPRGLREWAAIWLLLLGGLLACVGWLAGVILLWSSQLWTTRDKWIGTLILPGGLALSLVVFGFGGITAEVCYTLDEPGAGRTQQSCSGGPSTAESVLLFTGLALTFLAPIGTAIYLARRAMRSPGAAALPTR